MHRGNERCWHSPWETGRISRHGRTCSKSSNSEESTRLVYGSAMGTKPCSMPSPRNFPPPHASAVWCIRWITWLRYVPKKQQEQIQPELKALFYHNNREAADQAIAAFIAKYQTVYPTAVECLQRDLEACLTFYSFPNIGRRFVPAM